MTPLQEGYTKFVNWYFGGEKKANEFFHVLKTVQGLSQKEMTETLNKFREQWQKEIKQADAKKEHQTD